MAGFQCNTACIYRLHTTTCKWFRPVASAPSVLAGVLLAGGFCPASNNDNAHGTIAPSTEGVMSRVTLAFGSFIAGACCMFFIQSGIQPSTWAQTPVPAVGETYTIPTVPGLGPERFNDIYRNVNAVQLDGLNCYSCVIENSIAALRYGGGAYKLTDTQFIGPIRIQLQGAALNTLGLLVEIGAFKRPKGPPPAFNTPHKFEAAITNAVAVQAANPTVATLVSAVGATR